MIRLDTQPPKPKKRKYNVGRAERRRRREAAAHAETQQAKSLLIQFSEAHQATAHAASLTATVSGQLTRIYTSSNAPSLVPPSPLAVPTERITQDDIDSPLKEQEQEQQEQGISPRENTPSDVISLGDEEEEEQIRDTPYSPAQSTSLSPLQSPTFTSSTPNDYNFLGAGNLEQRISESQSRSTSATPQAPSFSNSNHTFIPQGPRRRYDSYRPQNRSSQQGRHRRGQPRLTRED